MILTFVFALEPAKPVSDNWLERILISACKKDITEIVEFIQDFFHFQKDHKLKKLRILIWMFNKLSKHELGRY